MRVFGLLVLCMASAGCGSNITGVAAHPLPGASQLDIPPGQCVTINAQPQTIPASVVSFELIDGGGATVDTYLVAAVPHLTTCGPDPLEATNLFALDETFSGSSNGSAHYAAGTYDLDVICENSVDCLITSLTWSAMY
jgi:hypothetical protein